MCQAFPACHGKQGTRQRTCPLTWQLHSRDRDRPGVHCGWPRGAGLAKRCVTWRAARVAATYCCCYCRVTGCLSVFSRRYEAKEGYVETRMVLWVVTVPERAMVRCLGLVRRRRQPQLTWCMMPCHLEPRGGGHRRRGSLGKPRRGVPPSPFQPVNQSV